jgi:hypothetical protein
MLMMVPVTGRPPSMAVVGVVDSLLLSVRVQVI